MRESARSLFRCGSVPIAMNNFAHAEEAQLNFINEYAQCTRSLALSLSLFLGYSTITSRRVFVPRLFPALKYILIKLDQQTVYY